MNLSQANVIVTGGMGALGKNIVDDLSSIVRNVIVIDKHLEGFEPTSKNVIGYTCDLCDETSVRKTIQTIHLKYSKIDVLINNAGYIANQPLINILSKENRKHSLVLWHEVIQNNLTSTFNISTEVADVMVQQKSGVIINISSISAQGNAGQSAYSAAKAGINALTQVWAKELAPFNIRSNAIAPGFVDVGSTKSSLSPEKLQKWKNQIPLGRLAQAKEISHTIRYIIENDYLNGTILSLDGGLKI